MNEYAKTSLYFAAALLAVLAAYFITPSKPGAANVDLSGQPWFAVFTDPEASSVIDVALRDSETSELRRFRVERGATGWSIPSNYSYPADNTTYVRQVATDFIGLERVARVTNLIEEHGKYGVIDPTEEGKAGTSGRGWRISFANSEGVKLADFIVGRRDPNDNSLRFIRAHGENEVYTAKLSTELSTDFERWVDTDILKLGRQQIKRVRFNNYSLDEASGRVVGNEMLRVAKNDDNMWEITSLAPLSNEDLRQKVLQNVLQEIDLLAIADVAPKADRVRKYLEAGEIEPTPDANALPNVHLTALGSGFYFAQERINEGGRVTLKKSGFLFGNEGEIDVTHEDGLVYTLRFGNSLTRKAETSLQDDGAAKERDLHYLMVSVTYDPSLHPAPVEPKKEDYLARITQPTGDDAPIMVPQPTGPTYANEEEATKAFDNDKREYDKNKREWETKKRNAESRASDQNKRFAKWFYLIDEDVYKRLRLPRKDLVKPLAQPVNLTEAGQKINLPSGLVIECIAPSTEADAQLALRGKRVRVLYEGKLIDGTVFDSNQDRTNPFTFKIGDGRVIEGWEDGVLGMKVGEKRRLVVPPSLGYGDEGKGDKIGPGAQLDFIIELIEVLDA